MPSKDNPSKDNTTDYIGESGGEQSQPNLQEIGEQPGQMNDLEARRAAAQRSERYDPEELYVAEDGSVRVRDEVRKRQVAKEADYESDDLRVTDDGSVEARGDPAPEATKVTVWDPGEDDPSGEVTWVGPDGERVETGSQTGASGDPYFAYVDVPEKQGEWELQVGGETVETVDVGPRAASRDKPQSDVRAGWNGTVISVDGESGEGEVTQTDYNPTERSTPASADEDVVAGAGAAEALQAGADPEQLSQRNPISEAEGERIASRLDEQEERETISDPTDLADADQNREVREAVADQLEDTSPDEVDIVNTGSGPEAVVDGQMVTSVGSGSGVPGRQPTDATFSGPGRSVGDPGTGAGTTASLEAARAEAREQLAGQSDRIDESDVQTEVVDGRVRATVTDDALRPETNREGSNPSRRALSPDPGGLNDDDAQPAGGYGRPQSTGDMEVEGQAERVADQSTRETGQSEQFGDVDWSAGYGGPEDEVEQFVDEDIPNAVSDATRPLDDAVAQSRKTTRGTGRPVGIVGAGMVGRSSPAQLGADFAGDILTMVDDSARAPASALEAVETAGYATGQVDDSGANQTGVIGYASDPEQATERGGEVAVAGAKVAERSASYAAENPQDVTTKALTGAVVSGGAGRAIGMAGRFGVDRVRTAGATKVDLEDVTNPETTAYFRGESTDSDARFPGADDPDLYEDDPAEAVRQQAADNTPEEIETQFEEAGVTEGTDLKKALETEPEGHSQSRIGDGAGFRTEEGSYESPGAFVGPELSPNFLGVGERSGYSLRPGLPSVGGRPTAVIARADVENPDADTMDRFNRELVDERAGETTARTKPAEEVNSGEIEAVIPPESSFRAVDEVASGGNRFGIGANYYTEVGGRRVPFRLVAPEDRVDVDAPNVDADGNAQRIDAYYRPPGEDIDRPTPTSPVSGRESVSPSERVSSPTSRSLAEASDGSRRTTRDDTRRVSDPLSQSFGAAATTSGSGYSPEGSSGSVTDIPSRGFRSEGFDRPIDSSGGYGFGQSGGGIGPYYNDPPTGGGEITTPTPIRPGDPYDPPADTPPTDTPPTDPPDIGDGNEVREYPRDAEVAPERFDNRIASPFEFLF